MKTPTGISQYRSIYETLRKEIIGGSIQPGGFLPSERELGDRFDVDRLTVRKALELLVEDGLVEKRAGIGTMVKELPVKAVPGKNLRNILFVLPNSPNSVDRITEPFNTALFHCIEKEMSVKGFSLTYMTLAPEDSVSRITDGHSVHGIFLASRFRDNQYEDCLKTGIPSILISHYHPGFLCVASDNERGAYQAVSHLCENRHREIGTILGSKGFISTGERYIGYKTALSDHGIDHRLQTQAEGDWTFTGGFQAMQSILRNAKPIPSAIFAQNDMMAFGAMEAIKEHGLSVPGDISVIGFDNLEQCEYSHPKLSTISVDIEGLAAIACRQLENFIDTGIRYRFKAVIPTRLVLRRSVGKPRSIAAE